MSPDPEHVTAEALRLVQEAEQEGLTLRISGGAAVHLRVADPGLLDRLGREPMSDVDLVAPRRHRGPLRKLFHRAGYEADQNMLASGEGRRFAFWHREPPHLEIDLFIDRLEMCHTLDWRERLDLPGPTLPVTDLLLQKLQIASLTEKDAADLIALLVTARERELDLEYAAALLRDDWGFQHTVELNLERVMADALARDLTADERARLHARVQETRAALESSPKTRRWQRRAKVGERRPWFEHVEDEKTAF